MNTLVKILVPILCSLLLAPAAFGQTMEAQYKALVKQGNAQLRSGNLAEAAMQLRAAAAMKASPAVLLKVVSIYSDFARGSGIPGAQCDETRNTMTAFFKVCDECVDTKTGACRVCQFVAPVTHWRTTAHRTMSLAERFEQESQAATQISADSTEEVRARSERKSTGFAAKARDVNRCLSRITVTTQPAGAKLRLGGVETGASPQTLTLFPGQHNISAELKGFPVKDRRAAVTAGSDIAVHFEFQDAQIALGLAPEKRGDVKAPDRSTATGFNWPIASMVSGLVVGGVGAYLMVSNSNEQQEIIREPEHSTFDAWKEAESDHTMGSAMLFCGSALIVGGLSWWLFKDDTTPRKSATAFELGLTPEMVFIGGEL